MMKNYLTFNWIFQANTWIASLHLKKVQFSLQFSWIKNLIPRITMHNFYPISYLTTKIFYHNCFLRWFNTVVSKFKKYEVLCLF